MAKIQEQKVYDGGVTAEQVKIWKGQHRKVARIEVEDGDEKHVGYFKRPSMETMAASTKVAKTDEVKAGGILFDGCWLGGSDDDFAQWYAEALWLEEIRLKNQAEVLARVLSALFGERKSM